MDDVPNHCPHVSSLSQMQQNACILNPCTLHSSLTMLTLPMLRLLSSKEKFIFGIHWKALAAYSKRSTHIPGFCFLHHFELAKLAASSIRVKQTIHPTCLGFKPFSFNRPSNFLKTFPRSLNQADVSFSMFKIIRFTRLKYFAGKIQTRKRKRKRMRFDRWFNSWHACNLPDILINNRIDGMYHAHYILVCQC